MSISADNMGPSITEIVHLSFSYQIYLTMEILSLNLIHYAICIANNNFFVKYTF